MDEREIMKEYQYFKSIPDLFKKHFISKSSNQAVSFSKAESA